MDVAFYFRLGFGWYRREFESGSLLGGGGSVFLKLSFVGGWGCFYFEFLGDWTVCFFVFAKQKLDNCCWKIWVALKRAWLVRLVRANLC